MNRLSFQQGLALIAIIGCGFAAGVTFQGSSPDASASETTGVEGSGDDQTQSTNHRRGPTDEEIIAVARDISPDWGRDLEATLKADPVAFRAATREGARRLRALAILRDRRPEVYRLRIDELRLNQEVRELGIVCATQFAIGGPETAATMRAQLNLLATRLVDANLRARALELSELDGVVRELRAALEVDAVARLETASVIAEALVRGDEMPALGGRGPLDEPRPTGDHAP
ncbi:MAG: hypothetical protein O2800_06045 [Planctomycetota bacterium]|nr:hypothetical protein [Planctomycetota bacterium]